MYDVLTTENNLQNLADFKIIETQTVPIVNNKALVQIDNVQIGTNALITAQITQNNQTLYEGKSDFFTVFEGQNQVKIQLKKVSISEPEDEIHPENPEPEDEIPPENPKPEDEIPPKNPEPEDEIPPENPEPEDEIPPENPEPEDEIPPENPELPPQEEPKNTISVNVQIPNSDVSFNINVSKIDTSINISIENLPTGYEIEKVLVDGILITTQTGQYCYSVFDTVDILFITVVIKDQQGNFYSKEIQYSVEQNKIVGE